MAGDEPGPALLRQRAERPRHGRRARRDGDRAQLVAFAAPDGDHLAWRLTVAGQGPYLYDEVVDAQTGALLARHSLTDFAVSNAEVYDYHPGAALGGAAHTVDIAPSLTDPNGTTLSGSYVHVFADLNDDNLANAGEEIGPSSGTNWDYPVQAVAPGSGVSCAPWAFCTWGGTGATLASEATNRAQAATQLFYFVNAYHQWLLQPAIGFDNASGNFEVGGTDGSDPVEAQADDSAQASSVFINNANMSTPPDGQSPTMQMYLFTSPFPAVNGSDDASIVYHEYTHGLSNRLIGNGDGLNANQSRAMGEGWSDWYAMDDLVANGFVTDTAADGQVVVGEYATGNTVHGIRNQPLDCVVGSNAPACGGSTAAGHGGGFTFADMGRVGGYNASTPSFEVHDDGEIWSETLWDLRKLAGPALARELITDAMRLSPIDPSFLDERDAILEADQVDDGGAHHEAIWQVFAVRGMGFGARTTSSNATRGVASFSTPVLAVAGVAAVDDSGDLGDGDLVAEPGEATHLTVVLGDPGAADLTHVSATLTSATPGVLVGRPQADYPTIAAGDLAQSLTPFAITVPASVACGALVSLTLHVTSDQGTIDLPLTVALGSGRGTFASLDSAQAIPDGFPGTGVASTVTVPTPGRVDHLRVNVNISHTWVGDLTVSLHSPGGKTIDLLERPGFGEFGSSDNWSGSLTFDDDAATPIQEIGDTGSTLAGSFLPDEPLAGFAGQDRAGTWTLRVTDAATPDPGTLQGWSLDTDQPACSTSNVLPTATTADATGVSTTAATLNGTHDDGSHATQYRFAFGTTTAYGQLVDASASGAALSAGLGGLTPATTYHFRLEAQRNGSVVAVGEDRSFTTSDAPGGGGGGGGQGGGGATGGGGSLGGGGTIGPPPAVTHRTARATLDRHARFAFTFDALPAGQRGSLRLVLPKHGRTRALLLGSAHFATKAAGHGRVRLVVTVRGAALSRIRRLRRARVTVTVDLDGHTFTSTLVLSAPPPAPRRHR